MDLDSAYEIDPALMAMRMLVFIIGSIGNTLVILVILILKEYRKAVTHWYVLQLAIADLLFLLSLPFKVAETWNDEWIFSAGLCKLVETTLFLNYYSSILFLMVMSMDRYIAVCKGFSKLPELRTPRTSKIIAVIVWMISLLLCIPAMLYSDKRGTNPKCKCRWKFPVDMEKHCIETLAFNESELARCFAEFGNLEACSTSDNEEFGLTFNYTEFGLDSHEYHDNDSHSEDEICSYEDKPAGLKAFIFFNFIVMFIIPVLVMTACYTLIAMRLNKSRARTSSNRASRRMSHADRKVTRVTIICGILVLLFVVCWLPYHVVHLAKMSGIPGTSEYCEEIVFTTSLLGFINSALNPYVYNFIGTKFRQRLRSAMGTVRGSVSQHSQRRRSGSKCSSNEPQSRLVRPSTNTTVGTTISDNVFVEEKPDTKTPFVSVGYDTSKETTTIQRE